MLTEKGSGLMCWHPVTVPSPLSALNIPETNPKYILNSSKTNCKETLAEASHYRKCIRNNEGGFGANPKLSQQETPNSVGGSEKNMYFHVGDDVKMLMMLSRLVTVRMMVRLTMVRMKMTMIRR